MLSNAKQRTPGRGEGGGATTTRMTKPLQSPKRSPLLTTKPLPNLPSSPRGKGGMAVSPVFSPLKDQRRSLVLTHGTTSAQSTSSYDKWSSLLNVSEEDLNRRYEEWMRIAADNVSDDDDAMFGFLFFMDV
jgi:hypothetical protein